MDNRVRTMSRGYVQVTEVMPARPPQRSRWYASKGEPGSFSKNYEGSVCWLPCCVWGAPRDLQQFVVDVLFGNEVCLPDAPTSAPTSRIH